LKVGFEPLDPFYMDDAFWHDGMEVELDDEVDGPMFEIILEQNKVT
jgi:hypothetical protein